MKCSRTAIASSWVALAALGLIGTRSTGQVHHADRPPAAVVETTELTDSPGALLAASDSANDSAAATAAPVVPTRDIEATSVLVPARKYHRVVRPYEEAG